MSSAENAPPTAFEGTTPILRVQNVEASILYYYAQQLGFHVNWQT